MKSLCVKTDNKEIASYLTSKLNSLNLDSLSISNKKFKLYNNIISHYTSNNLDLFYDKFATVLTNTIIHFYEHKLLKRTLEYNYFYFSSNERKKILEIAEDFLLSDDIAKEDNYFAIYYSILDYIQENKSLILERFY